jgi:SAM-dependent methyltransferase
MSVSSNLPALVILDRSLLANKAHEGYMHAGEKESRRLAKQAEFKRSRVLADALQLLRTAEPGSLDVLELPCGSGEHTSWLLRSFPSIRSLVAVDFSSTLIEDARRKCDGFADRATFYLADGTRLADYPEFAPMLGSFDLCLTFMFFEHLPGQLAREQAAQAIHRCLKPEGRLFSSECSSILLQFLPPSEDFALYYRAYCDLQNQDLLGEADMGIRMASLLEIAGFDVPDEPTVVSFCRRRSVRNGRADEELRELLKWARGALFSCRDRLIKTGKVSAETAERVAAYLKGDQVQVGLYGLVNTVAVKPNNV